MRTQKEKDRLREELIPKINGFGRKSFSDAIGIPYSQINQFINGYLMMGEERLNKMERFFKRR